MFLDQFCLKNTAMTLVRLCLAPKSKKKRNKKLRHSYLYFGNHLSVNKHKVLYLKFGLCVVHTFCFIYIIFFNVLKKSIL